MRFHFLLFYGNFVLCANTYFHFFQITQHFQVAFAHRPWTLLNQCTDPAQQCLFSYSCSFFDFSHHISHHAGRVHTCTQSPPSVNEFFIFLFFVFSYSLQKGKMGETKRNEKKKQDEHRSLHSHCIQWNTHLFGARIRNARFIYTWKLSNHINNQQATIDAAIKCKSKRKRWRKSSLAANTHSILCALIRIEWHTMLAFDAFDFVDEVQTLTGNQWRIKEITLVRITLENLFSMQESNYTEAITHFTLCISYEWIDGGWEIYRNTFSEGNFFWVREFRTRNQFDAVLNRFKTFFWLSFKNGRIFCRKL